MLKKIRVALALLFFLGVTALFLDYTGAIHLWLGWMAKIQFLPAVLAANVVVIVALVLLTLVFGRVYCSVICPLGVMQDVVAHLHPKKNRYNYHRELRWVRYPIWVLFAVVVVLGVGSAIALLDPYAIYGRIAQNLLQPVWMWAGNLLAKVAEHYDSYAFYSREVWLRSLPTFVVAVVSVVAIGLVAWFGGRTYCNTICPVGTTLSFFSRFSLFKVRFDAEKCRNCSQCTTHCKASCIDHTTHTVDYSRCVSCGNCLNKCKFGALKYSFALGKSKTETKVDESKRAFLAASAMVAGTAVAQEAKKVDGGFAPLLDRVVPERKTPITPPGSISARNMARHCTACQLCVSDCPNNVLRPSTEISTFMQPVMSYERGYCRPECTRCSTVCPTGAIVKIDASQKSSLQIGHAVWEPKNCVVLTDGVTCGNCARHCPTQAITMVNRDPSDESSPMVPAVNEARCIGCGACENLCPARPFPAIHVEGYEEHHSY
ncbi:MAG: 4Fe-4S dicluster domain-containing protein [Bacteroidales bacterium]|nr:4Fe-4S dicluster domain-containing protein [Bacteroidales bacterium]